MRDRLKTVANRLVSDQRGKYHQAIDRLPEKRRDAYREIAAMAAAPEDRDDIRRPPIPPWVTVWPALARWRRGVLACRVDCPS